MQCGFHAPRNVRALPASGRTISCGTLTLRASAACWSSHAHRLRDQPSIGIILCAEKDDVEVEYALRTKANPIGVAAYALQSKLPGELKGKLPTAKQLADIVRAEMEEGK